MKSIKKDIVTSFGQIVEEDSSGRFAFCQGNQALEVYSVDLSSIPSKKQTLAPLIYGSSNIIKTLHNHFNQKARAIIAIICQLLQNEYGLLKISSCHSIIFYDDNRDEGPGFVMLRNANIKGHKVIFNLDTIE